MNSTTHVPWLADEPLDRSEMTSHMKHVTPLLKSPVKQPAPLIHGSVSKVYSELLKFINFWYTAFFCHYFSF